MRSGLLRHCFILILHWNIILLCFKMLYGYFFYFFLTLNIAFAPMTMVIGSHQNDRVWFVEYWQFQSQHPYVGEQCHCYLLLIFERDLPMDWIQIWIRLGCLYKVLDHLLCICVECVLQFPFDCMIRCLLRWIRFQFASNCTFNIASRPNTSCAGVAWSVVWYVALTANMVNKLPMVINNNLWPM